MLSIEHTKELSCHIPIDTSECYGFLAWRIFTPFFESPSNLRVLNIYQCTAIDEDCLWAIATKHPNLECVEFKVEDHISEECYLALMDLPKLKKVKIYHHHKTVQWDMGVLISRLAVHNRLESLNVYFGKQPISPETWGAIRTFTNLKVFKTTELNYCPHIELLGMASADTLEELSLSFTEISNLGIEKLVEKFKNIRSIDILQCNKLTHEFLPKILKHLTGRRHKLTIKGWSIFTSWEYEERYNSDLLQVVAEDFD